MSEYKTKLSWKPETENFSYKNYTRTHQWSFGGGQEVTASAAPEFLGKAEFVNPEEAFAASLGSCHLLTFLAIASFKKFSIRSYTDECVAIVEKNEARKQAVTKVYLRPKVEFYDENLPDDEEIKEMHHKAHNECFISNSVLTEVIVEPVLQ